MALSHGDPAGERVLCIMNADTTRRESHATFMCVYYGVLCISNDNDKQKHNKDDHRGADEENI